MNLNQRPHSLAEVAARADDARTLGLELQDWLHTLRSIRFRAALRRSIEEEPVRLRDRFAEGQYADAWLAAYAEHTAKAARLPVPSWTRNADRIAPEPWFTVAAPDERLLALRDSPPAFKNRNLFTPMVDLPINLRPGRPPVSAEQRRRKNAERQRRFRQRRAAELAQLRAKEPDPRPPS